MFFFEKITDKWIKEFKQKDTLQQLAILIVEGTLRAKFNVVKLWDALENKNIFFTYMEYIFLDRYLFLENKHNYTSKDVKQTTELKMIYDKYKTISEKKHNIDISYHADCLTIKNLDTGLVSLERLNSVRGDLRYSLLDSTLAQKIAENTFRFPNSENSYQYGLYQYLRWYRIAPTIFNSICTFDILRFMCSCPFNQITKEDTIYMTTENNQFNEHMYHDLFAKNKTIWESLMNYVNDYHNIRDIDSKNNIKDISNQDWFKLLMANYSFDKVKKSLYDSLFILVYGRQYLSQDQLQELRHNIKKRILNNNIKLYKVPIFLLDEEDLQVINPSIFIKKIQQNIT